MSRLIVKNLPKNVTEAKIKELFSEKGVVTNVQLKYTKNGEFRRFGFVGFKTQEQAEQAREYFDRTCIDTSRISVEMCTAIDDAAKPKPWSKHAADNSAHQKSAKIPSESAQANSDGQIKGKSKKDKKKEKKEKENAEIAKAVEKHKDDPLFWEFLDLHAGGKAKMLWDNDAVDSLKKVDANDKSQETNEDSGSEESSAAEQECEESATREKEVTDKQLSDLELTKALRSKNKELGSVGKTVDKAGHGSKEFFTVKVRGLGCQHKKKHVKQFFKPLKAHSIRVPRNIKGIAYVGFKTEKLMKQALNKDKSFLEGKRLFVTVYETKANEKESYGEEKKDIEPKWKKQEEGLKNEESIAESGKIFFRNLPYDPTIEDEVRKLFEKYGQLSEFDLPIDKTTGKLKGFGSVTFVMPEHAVKAFSELDYSVFNGRMLHLLPGKANQPAIDPLNQDGLTFKQKKELEKKAKAGSSYNWNTLFLGQDAVAEAIASAYNTTKDKVLLEDGEKGGASVAVRLALGEAQLVQDTRKFMEENGVCLDAFNQEPTERSKKVILVKNLPAKTQIQEVREKFAQFGELVRAVMPPFGMTALVEFSEASKAREAFKKLAYSKFKCLPLYLEWAPINSFNAPAKKVEKENEVEDEPEPDTTIFVKNLNFSTTDETLKNYFSKCGPLHHVTVATKKDPNNPGQKLSMGYGFVQYKYKSDANRALKELQMTVLEDKQLELQRSERILASEVATAAGRKTSKITGQTGTKILVRNLPFEAGANEVKELFKPFGEIKAVRLPKKWVGPEKHRGFGFVEYYTKSDAKRAFEALQPSTHLLGKRLNLSWAQAEENVDDIRKRTAKHFHPDDSTNQRSKKAVLEPDSLGLAAE